MQTAQLGCSSGSSKALQLAVLSQARLSFVVPVQQASDTTPVSMSAEACKALRVSKLKEFRALLRKVEFQREQVQPASVPMQMGSKALAGSTHIAAHAHCSRASRMMMLPTRQDGSC